VTPFFLGWEKKRQRLGERLAPRRRDGKLGERKKKKRASVASACKNRPCPFHEGRKTAWERKNFSQVRERTKYRERKKGKKNLV